MLVNAECNGAGFSNVTHEYGTGDKLQESK